MSKSKPITYKEIKPTNRVYDRNKIMLLTRIWQDIYRSNLRREPITKIDLIFKYGKHKKIVEKIWECVYDLKIEWPYQMYDRVFD